MAFKDISGIIALVGVVLTAGVVFTSLNKHSVPRNAVIAFDTKNCPNGWGSVPSTEGRYLVGIPEGEETGQVIGIKLKLHENRVTGKHSHDYQRPRGFQSATGTHDRAKPDGPTMQTGPAGEVEGTNAPYIEYLFCKKL